MPFHESNVQLDADITIPGWQARSLIRIVAEQRDPRWKDGDGWFRELAARAGVDLSFADASNRRVA